MDAESWFEISYFMEVVFEAFAQSVAIGRNEVNLHLVPAYQAITEINNNLNVISILKVNKATEKIYTFSEDEQKQQKFFNDI